MNAREPKQPYVPGVNPLPNLVDEFLHAANALKWHAMQLVTWHARFDVAGGHLSDGALTVAEQLHLDRLLVDLKTSHTKYVLAHDAFVSARSAALARQRVR